MAKNTVSRRILDVAAPAMAGVLLAGCVNFTALDDLKTAKPAGSPFSQALFDDYAFIARSFGDVGQAGYTSFDQRNSMSLTATGYDVAALANNFASKALALSRGEQIDPEASHSLEAHTQRDRLVRALNAGRDGFPRDAARAQADFDCWMLNATVASQAGAAAQCRHSLDITLPRLEAEARVMPIAPADTAASSNAATPADATTPAATPAAAPDASPEP